MTEAKLTAPTSRDFEAVAELLESVAWGVDKADELLSYITKDSPAAVKTGVGMAWGFLAPKGKVIAGQCRRVAAVCRREVARRAAATEGPKPPG